MDSIAILPDIKATILAAVKANGITASSEASQLAMEALTNYKLETLLKANIEAYGLNNVTNQLASLLIQPILTKTNGELIEGLVFDQMYMAKSFDMPTDAHKAKVAENEPTTVATVEVKAEATVATTTVAENEPTTAAVEEKADTDKVEVKAAEVKAEVKTTTAEEKATEAKVEATVEAKATTTTVIKFQWSDLVRATANTPVVPPSDSTFVNPTKEVEEKAAPMVRSTLNSERRKTVTSRMWAFANKFFLTEEKDAFLWEFDEEGYPIGYIWDGDMCKSYHNDQFSYRRDQEGNWHIFEDYYYTDRRNNERRGYSEVSVDYFTWMITPPYKREGRCPAK